MMMKASIVVALFAATTRAFEVTSSSSGNQLTSGVVGEPLSRNWVWTCGTQTCDGSPSTGTVKLSAPTVTADDKWLAVLVRNGDSAPYGVKSVSSVILVKSSCSAPTDISQAQPAPSPIAPTVSSAISVSNTVATTKSSYSSGDTITVKFTAASPATGDWVAIFDAGSTLNSQDEPHFWLWAGCNRQGSSSGCSKTAAGTVVFSDNKDISWRTKWPLPPGKYVAALLRDDDNSPWSVIVTSASFTVRKPPFGPAAVELARRDIKAIVKKDIKLASKFLRLAFHDSVGGVDGCVDLSNIHNKGLLEPIRALAPIVSAHEGNLTRGDIWFLAALEGSRVSQDPDESFHGDFELTEFGRINCEKQQTICRNEHGTVHPCISTRGPHREIPGIQGKDGWVLDNRIMNNGYYAELIGGGPQSSMNSKINNAPNWKRFFERQDSGSQFDDVGIWHGLPEGENGRVIVMLNADMALVRDLDSDNMNSETGKVKCQFVERSGNDPVCPGVSGAINQAAKYKNNNGLWITDFEKVLRKMANAKYKVTSNCIEGLCKLAKA
ncbi:peroxidase [Fragilaria crotonensis]|nr:peroxidase [Fragilaria crotonensis]